MGIVGYINKGNYMDYTAMVKDKDSGKQSLITSNYPTLKAFKADLKANGYSIVYASTAKYFKAGIRAFWAKKDYMNKDTHIFVYGE
jgi:hypothetical protein